jgi:hypothetical protein
LYLISFLSCSNEPSFDRIDADFVANIYSKLDSTKSYQVLGQYSIIDDRTKIYGVNVFRTSNTMQIITKYRWIKKVNEWGYEGWKIVEINSHEKKNKLIKRII